MYKFSIIIPVYNVEKYIDKCLSSIENQTYKSSKIQVIIIDDGSSDNSSKIYNNYISRNESWEAYYFSRDENSGLGNARNKGMKYVKGEYIFFFDSDDYINSNMFEKINNYSKEYDFEMLMFNYERVYEKKSIINKLLPNSLNMEQSYGQISPTDFTKMSHCAWNKIFKYERYKDLLFENTLFEDIPLNLEVIKTDKLLIVKDKFLNYLIRDGSIMTQKFDENKFKISIQLFNLIESEISSDYKNEFMYRKIKFGYIFIIYNMWRSKYNPSQISKYIREMCELLNKDIIKYMSLYERLFIHLMKFKYKRG